VLKESLLIGAGLLLHSPLTAQVECRANLDSLATRIEQNYAGYTLEITGDRLRQYQQRKEELSREAARTAADRCFPILARLTNWFDDPHLFIYQGERLDSEETRRRMARVARHPVDEAELRTRLTKRKGRHDPIEGIWYDGALRLAVVPEPGPGGRFLAVVLSSDTATWTVGDVRARITPNQDRSYDVELATRDHATRKLTAELHRRVLLRLSPGIWGKEFPVQPADSGALDPTDAHRATWQRRGETGILAIPSHDPTYLPALQEIGRQHIGEFASLRFLIVDLRGNEGGSSWVTTPLMPYIRSATPRASRYGADTAVLLSSPAQIAYARRAFGSDTSAFVRSLVARMEAAPGQLVPMRDPALPPEPETAPEVADGPVRVAVLVDGGTVSASEVLVLEALRSTRAVVIGEPTAGALDYQSVNVIRLSKDENRWYLGYPTILRHPRIPAKERMRGAGIQPDAVVRWSEVGDEMKVVERILRR
jgi:hypothetical protein